MITDNEKFNELFTVCEKFIIDNNILCAEEVWQSDRIVENSYEFIERICNIVGYRPYDEDE